MKDSGIATTRCRIDPSPVRIIGVICFEDSGVITEGYSLSNGLPVECINVEVRFLDNGKRICNGEGELLSVFSGGLCVSEGALPPSPISTGPHIVFDEDGEVRILAK